MKRYTRFRTQVYTRHPSHAILRTDLPLLPFRSVIRLGSETRSSRPRIECNSINAVRISSNKLLMKEAFKNANIKAADWWTFGRLGLNNKQTGKLEGVDNMPFPLVIKSLYGSRGNGNYLINNAEELNTWLDNHPDLSIYIVEKYYPYTREYRLHVTEFGCFYTCRKLIKNETPDKNRWYRNDDNCNWIVENNPSFNKPVNWKDIEKECVKALKAVGLDIGAFDVRVQSDKKSNPDFVILESNSAPSFGNITAQKYLEVIPKILKKKYVG